MLPLNFCLTFVRGLGPDQVLARLGGCEPVEIVAVRRLKGAAELVPCLPKTSGSGHLLGYRSTGLVFVAAASLGEWTMIVEPNGFLCTRDTTIGQLCVSGELVLFYCNEKIPPSFLWARDGMIQVEFDPHHAGLRSGAAPGRLTDVLTHLGFHLGTEVVHDTRFRERVLALMHHLTGVRVTPDLLENAVFRCSAVPDPDTWPSIISDPARAAPYTLGELVAGVRARLAAYAADPGKDAGIALLDP